MRVGSVLVVVFELTMSLNYTLHGSNVINGREGGREGT